MHLPLQAQRHLHVAVAASVHGRLVAGRHYRERPADAARRARRHAIAAVREVRNGSGGEISLTLADRRRLFVAVAAATQAELVSGKPSREKAVLAAVLAKAHAEAAFDEARIDAQQAKRRSR